MVPSLRKDFNKNFTKEKYEAFLKDLNSVHEGAIEFRVAETPVFVPKGFTKKMLENSKSLRKMQFQNIYKCRGKIIIPIL